MSVLEFSLLILAVSVDFDDKVELLINRYRINLDFRTIFN